MFEIRARIAALLVWPWRNGPVTDDGARCCVSHFANVPERTCRKSFAAHLREHLAITDR
jgi:hypothetical protein